MSVNNPVDIDDIFKKNTKSMSYRNARPTPDAASKESRDRLRRCSFILDSPATYKSFTTFASDVEAIAALGYGAIELQLRTPEDVNITELASLLASCGLRFCAFQTGFAYLEKHIYLASVDQNKRQAAADLLKRYVDLAARFQAIVVLGLLQGTRGDEPNPQVRIAHLSEELSILAEYAAAAGVVIVIEPVNRYECDIFHNTAADVLRTVNRIASAGLRAMIDTFHANIEERSETEAARLLAPVLAHVHLSETNRGLFGSGHLDFSAFFRVLEEIQYPGFVSIGIYRQNGSAADHARSARDHLNGVFETLAE